MGNRPVMADQQPVPADRHCAWRAQWEAKKKFNLLALFNYKLLLDQMLNRLLV